MPTDEIEDQTPSEDEAVEEAPPEAEPFVLPPFETLETTKWIPISPITTLKYATEPLDTKRVRLYALLVFGALGLWLGVFLWLFALPKSWWSPIVAFMSVVAVAVPPSLYLGQLSVQMKRRTPTVAQLEATCDRLFVGEKMFDRCRYLLNVDKAHPEHSETVVRIALRENWDGLLAIVWRRALVGIGATALVIAIQIVVHGSWLPIWVIPLGFIASASVKGMTDWYYSLYLLTDARLMRVKCPPLLFDDDRQQILMTSITNVGRRRRWFSKFFDSEVVELEGKAQEDTRWHELHHIPHAEAFEEAIGRANIGAN